MTDFSGMTGEGREERGEEEGSPRADLCFGWMTSFTSGSARCQSRASRPGKMMIRCFFLCFSDGLCCALCFFWGMTAAVSPVAGRGRGSRRSRLRRFPPEAF